MSYKFFNLFGLFSSYNATSTNLCGPPSGNLLLKCEKRGAIFIYLDIFWEGPLFVNFVSISFWCWFVGSLKMPSMEENALIVSKGD